MIDVDEAYERLFSNITPLETVELPLDAALERTLAVPVRCDVDYPPFDRSVMDGYAVRAADVADAPVTLKVVDQLAAGSSPTKALGPGQAMQINTGAPIPSGADAVIRVEHTVARDSDGSVEIRESAPAGTFITPRATYVQAGQTVLDAGTALTPAAIAAAANAGASNVTVYRGPTVAILGTGNELVDIDQVPTGAQIRNSNQHLLSALVHSAHCSPVVLGVAIDDRDAIREQVNKGLQSDVLCITGGISMGAFDFVPEVLEKVGATLHIRKMKIKPGRPTIFATTPSGKLIFALPGNPGSAYVGFELLVRPALAALQGRANVVPTRIRATIEGSLSQTRDRRTFIPARLRVEDGVCVVEVVSWHGSGDSFGLARSNALIERKSGADRVSPGDMVSVLLLDSLREAHRARAK